MAADKNKSLKQAFADWENNELAKVLEKRPERQEEFYTLSDKPVKRLYTPLDNEDLDLEKDLALPGQYPYTRGVHETMYRGKLWTMRQFAGFGTAKDTNKRFRYLLSQGQTGLSVAFHMPTIMGYDSDHDRSRGEVGKTGVSIDTLEDMETLFEGIPLDEVTTSMTINAPATILYAMYLVVAEKQGVPWSKVRGTTQNDILKEYIAQKSWIYPPKPSMRLIVDMMEFSSKEVPGWNTISISGYHIREAGSTAAQELAFTLADGIAYVQAGIERGMDVDDFAPRLSYFFNAHNDFFEEIGKFRAARRIWARIMKERFGAKNPKSLMCRFHTQTAGCSLTAQQPYNNVVRTTMQALSAVLGGTQSLHTNSLDETLALPTEETARLALRTQQVIAEESGVASTIDPLGGSYFVEAMTDSIEKEALAYIEKIDAMGGMIEAIEKGYPQREIGNSAYKFQRQVESGEKIVVGVNKYLVDEEEDIPTLVVAEKVEAEQIENVKRIKQKRDNAKVEESLRKLNAASKTQENLMPHIIEAVRNYASLGEICDVFRENFGEYHDPKWL
ncbi:MAG TPA: methylmalonyl-CoA mutase family protein [Oligoflexia bacterium]|nr:methylmalonyl-CoA mutase family protein [Oligoflexia bacterium]HMR24989.1 methylmalonyl-CoA mutase family protein [Oligoflexia bacterium]